MVPFILATVITCRQLVDISERLVKSANLPLQQKVHIFLELRKTVPNCPVYIDQIDPVQTIKLRKNESLFSNTRNLFWNIGLHSLH